MFCRSHRPTQFFPDDDGDEYDVAIALLTAAKQHLEDQEREIADLKQRLKMAEAFQQE